MGLFDTKCTNNIDLANRLKSVATDFKTLYVMGCFGAPMNEKNKLRYCNNIGYNREEHRTAMIQSATDDTFGFDCVCLIKGILWGWRGDKSKVYGGATYKSNDVPDIGTESIIEVCNDVSTDFSKIEVGELVWLKGHVGVYVGNGLAVECSPAWKNCVQLTACNGSVKGYNRRNWAKHGKLPYINYLPFTEHKTTFPIYIKDVKTKLSENFISTEFDCKGKDCCISTAIDPKLITHLQKIRSHFNSETIIKNGYMCEKYYNSNFNDILTDEKYQHLIGKAADISIKGVDPKVVAQYAEIIGVKGIGLYNTEEDGYFVHIDTRDTKSFWKGKTIVKVDTFQEPITVNTEIFSTGSDEDQKIMWNFLFEKLQNEFAVAGIMGNLYAESGLRSNNLQQTYEKKLSHTDDTYTAAVDNGTYVNFVKDSAGYGLAQWTYWSRKEMLLKFATEAKKSIGDYQMQLEFLWYELTRNFSSLVKQLKASTSVKEASNLVLHKFEQPADQSETVEMTRSDYSQNYYNKFHIEVKNPDVEVIEPNPEPQPEIVTPEDKKTLAQKIMDLIEFIIGLFKKSR